MTATTDTFLSLIEADNAHLGWSREARQMVCAMFGFDPIMFGCNFEDVSEGADGQIVFECQSDYDGLLFLTRRTCSTGWWVSGRMGRGVETSDDLDWSSGGRYCVGMDIRRASMHEFIDWSAVDRKRELARIERMSAPLRFFHRTILRKR